MRKIFIFAIMAAVSAFSASAWEIGEEVTYNGFIYKVIDGGLRLNGADSSCPSEAIVPYALTQGATEYRVIEINQYASIFKNCTEIRFNCVLDQPVVSQLNGMDKNKIRTVMYNGSFKEIGPSIFDGFRLLSTVEIPGVTTIGQGAFRNCTSLTHIDLSASLNSLGKGVFSGSGLVSIDLPWALENVPSSAFSNCTSLASVTFGPNVKTLGDGAFYGCTALTTMEIPEGVTYIDAQCFRDCTSLTSLSLPSTLETVYSGILSNCKSLTSLYLNSADPESVFNSDVFNYFNAKNCTVYVPLSLLGKYKSMSIFDNFREVKGLYVPVEFTVGDYNYRTIEFDLDTESPKVETYFNGSCYEGDANAVVPATVEWEGLTYTVAGIGEKTFYRGDIRTVSLPETLEYIGDSAFLQNYYLQSVALGDNVTKIGNKAFSECNVLGAVDLGSGVAEIGDGCFEYCRNLKALTLPASLRKLGARIFYSADAMESLVVLVADPSQIDVTADPFKNWSRMAQTDLVVLAGSVELYQNDPYWGGKFKSVSCTNVGDTFTYDGINYKILTLDGVNNTCETSMVNNRPNDGGIVSIPSEVIGKGHRFTVIGIGDYSFGYSSLFELTLPSTLRYIDDSAFYECDHLKTVVVPEGVERIGSEAFSECDALTSVELPATITEMGTGVFSNCPELPNVVLPRMLGEIPGYTFNGCYKLDGYVIEDNITKIGWQAFGYNKGMTKLETKIDDPAKVEVADDTFVGTDIAKATLIVPRGSKALYEAAAPWNGFGNIEEVEIVYYYNSFETEADRNSAMTFDMNGDGYNWRFAGDDGLAHDGDWYLCSDSYYKGQPLTPENNLFIPSVFLPEEGAVMTWYVAPINYDYQAEHYRVIVNVGDESVSFDETLGGFEDGTWQKRTLEIPFKGTATLTFVHCDVTDQLAIRIDDIKIVAGAYAPAVAQGDANGDGSINAIDLAYVIDTMLGEEHADFDTKAADVNGDGNIDATDLAGIIEVMLGK